MPWILMLWIPYYEEVYFFDDPSLYDDYITDLEASGVSAEGLQATDQIFSEIIMPTL